MDIKKVLKGLSLFATFEDDDLQKVSEICEIRKIATDNVIFAEGAEGSELFIVISGCVKIYTQITENVEKTLITLRDGGLFGELSVISEDYRTASARAMQDSELIVINQSEFEKLLDEHPIVGKKILDVFVRIISERLKNTTELYRQAVDWGLSISGILDLNYSQLISHRSQISVDLNSGKSVTGILLKADKNNVGLELLLETDQEELIMIPYGAISSISFDKPINNSKEEE